MDKQSSKSTKKNNTVQQSDGQIKTKNMRKTKSNKLGTNSCT